MKSFEDNMEQKEITDKDWLDLAWKHFQQHAQQKILYLNYFVLFSTILSTGLISTFQNNFQMPVLGIGIGLIQVFLSYIFCKIDERNKFLTKHSETSLISIETFYKEKFGSQFHLFSSEKTETDILKESDKKINYFKRQLSHGKAYRIIFITFAIIGILGICISTYNLIRTANVKPENISKFENFQRTVDSIKEGYTSQIDDIKKLHSKLDQINLENKRRDSIYMNIEKWQQETKTAKKGG